MKIISMLLVSIGFAGSTFASGEKGNGGGAFVCRNPDHTLRSLEMYDLYEGTRRYDFPQLYLSAVTYDDLLGEAFGRLRDAGMDSLVAKIQFALTLVRAKIHRTEDDLEPTFDASRTRRAHGCGYEQVATWDDRTNRIDVDQKIYDLLSPRDLAALHLHEALYYIDRTYAKDVSSDETRETVARIFMLQPIRSSIARAAQSSGIRSIYEEYGAAFGRILHVSWAKEGCYTHLFGQWFPRAEPWQISLEVLPTAETVHAKFYIGERQVIVGKPYTVGRRFEFSGKGRKLKQVKYRVTVQNSACGDVQSAEFTDDALNIGMVVDGDYADPVPVAH